MSLQLNFKELKERISVVQCAEFLGLSLREDGNSLRCSCPACGGDDRSLSLLPEKNTFKCFPANKYGSIIDLVSHVKGLSLRQTEAWLNESVSTSSDKAGESSRQSPKDNRPVPVVLSPLAAIPKFNPHASEVSALGLDPDIAELVGVGLGSNGLQRGYIGVLLFDLEELAEHGIMPVGSIGIPKGTAVKIPKNIRCSGGKS